MAHVEDPGVQLLLFLVSVFFFLSTLMAVVMNVKIGRFTLGFILSELIRLEDHSVYLKIIVVRITTQVSLFLRTREFFSNLTQDKSRGFEPGRIGWQRPALPPNHNVQNHFHGYT
jgi:amino acid transporter